MTLLSTLTGVMLMTFAVNTIAFELVAMNDCQGNCKVDEVSNTMLEASNKVADSTGARDIAQAVLNNPNDELKEKYGLTDENIKELCHFAQTGGYNWEDWPIEPIFEKILEIDGVSYKSFETPQKYQEYIGERWNEVYSKVNCEGNGVTRATLDGIAFYNEKTSWVYSLYNKENHFNADINSVRVFDSILELEFTIYDFLTDLAEVHPDDKVKKYPDFKDQLLRYANELKKVHGALSIKELKAEAGSSFK